MRRIRVFPAAAAGLTLALSACGGGSGSAEGTPDRTAPTATAPPTTIASPTPDTSPTPEPAVVPAAFEFSAPALGGGRVIGADYADTGVALWFWAPW